MALGVVLRGHRLQNSMQRAAFGWHIQGMRLMSADTSSASIGPVMIALHLYVETASCPTCSPQDLLHVPSLRAPRNEKEGRRFSSWLYHPALLWLGLTPRPASNFNLFPRFALHRQPLPFIIAAMHNFRIEHFTDEQAPEMRSLAQG